MISINILFLLAFIFGYMFIFIMFHFLYYYLKDRGTDMEDASALYITFVFYILFLLVAYYIFSCFPVDVSLSDFISFGGV